MNEMKTYTKTKTILAMVLAPVLYFLVGQMVATVAAVVWGSKLAAQGISGDDLALKLTDILYEHNVLLTMAAALITFPIVYFIFYQRETAYAVNKRSLFLPVPFGITVCVTVNMLISLSQLPKYFPTYEKLAEAIYQGNILFEIIGIAVVPALIEELIYRGVVYKGFRQFFAPLWANLFSALVFGVMHMNVVQFVYALILGILFAWVYERYKNLWAPILMHMSANIFSILMTEWSPLQQFMSTAAGGMLTLFLILAGDIFIPMRMVKTVHAEKKEDAL